MDNLTSSRKVSRPSSGRPSSSRPTSSSQVVSSIRRPTPDQTPPRMTSSGGRNRTDPFAEEEHTDEDELHIIPNTSGDFYHKKYQDVQAEQHSARVARIGDLSARLEEEAKPLSARKQDYGQVLKPRGKPIDTSCK